MLSILYWFLSRCMYNDNFFQKFKNPIPKIWIIFVAGYLPGILITATSIVTKSPVRIDNPDQNYSYEMQIWKSIHGLDVLWVLK